MSHKKKVNFVSSRNKEKSQKKTQAPESNQKKILKSQEPKSKTNPNRYTLFDQEKLCEIDIENYLKDLIVPSNDPYHCICSACKGEPF